VQQIESDAVPIGEAEAQCVSFLIENMRENRGPVMARSIDTDIVMLSLLAFRHMVPADESAPEPVFWLDLTCAGKKRFLNVTEMWRSLHLVARCIEQNIINSRGRLCNVIEWFVLLLNLTGNDYCDRQSHLSVTAVLSCVERFLAAEAVRENKSLLFCDQTFDMIVRESAIIDLLRDWLRKFPVVDKAIKGSKHELKSSREFFDFVSSKLAAAAHTNKSALVVVDYNFVRARVRRAVACLHYQRHVFLPDFRPLDAYKLGNDRKSLFGYEKFNRSLTSSASPPVDLYRYEFAKTVTSLHVDQHPFMRVRIAVENKKKQPDDATVRAALKPAAAAIIRSNGDNKAKKVRRADEVESIDSDDEDAAGRNVKRKTSVDNNNNNDDDGDFGFGDVHRVSQDFITNPVPAVVFDDP
jgi:hypothetical protein